MNIFLIGFMGSGKSHVGSELACALGVSFLDLDTVIEEKVGLTIPEIFSTMGEDAFRTLEAQYLRQLPDWQNTIIATGGGTPCFHNNMDWMNQNGVTIFLDVSTTTLAERLQNGTEERPLLRGKSKKELHSYIEEKLSSRRSYYEQAHFVCHADGPAAELVQSVAGYFRRFLKK